MAGREWTDAERRAFGERMTALRAAKKSTPEVSEMAAAVKATEKQFAGREDVPAGVRPIAQRSAVTGRELDPNAVAGLQQAPDTGFAATQGAKGFEVSSDTVIGGGTAQPSGGIPAGQNKVPNASAILFSDKKEDGGLPNQLRRARGHQGPAEPTGLPCTCNMPTKLRGQSDSITWCSVCGGERDRVARPENALKATSAAAAMANAGVVLDPAAIAGRVLALIDYDYIATLVAQKLAATEVE